MLLLPAAAPPPSPSLPLSLSFVIKFCSLYPLSVFLSLSFSLSLSLSLCLSVSVCLSLSLSTHKLPARQPRQACHPCTECKSHFHTTSV